MANTNCLEGIRCPTCGNEDRLFISSSCLFEVTDEGAEPLDANVEYGKDSHAICPVCDHRGLLEEFYISH